MTAHRFAKAGHRACLEIHEHPHGPQLVMLFDGREAWALHCDAPHLTAEVAATVEDMREEGWAVDPRTSA